MLDNTEEFRCLSLCSGYGGIELGFERLVPNFRTVCYVEVEAFACANLVAKIEQGKLAPAPVWTDIKTFDGRPFCGRVHIITAGYPCQGESVAGKRKGKADPRWLWPYIERTLEAVRPVWFFGENVSGHLRLGFPTVYRSLRNLGYSVEAGLFTAAECGAPHKRERLFILAYSTERWGRRDKNKGKIWSLKSPKTKTQRPSELDKSETAKRRRLSKKHTGRGIEEIGRYDGMWPSRPGQPQYEWEEPRVIMDDTKSQRKETKEQQGQRAGFKQTSNVDDARKAKSIRLSSSKQKETSEISNTGKEQAQSRLGGTAYGTASRVDRLRLLGNGVVPQCAELAFRTLIEKFDVSDTRIS